MNNTLSNEVIEFVYKQRWKYKIKLTRDTVLEDDLKITGDDANDFMKSFFNEFDIEIRNFESGTFFGDDGFSLINLSWLFSRKKKRSQPTPLTLGHLEKVIELGYWIDP